MVNCVFSQIGYADIQHHIWVSVQWIYFFLAKRDFSVKIIWFGNHHEFTLTQFYFIFIWFRCFLFSKRNFLLRLQLLFTSHFLRFDSGWWWTIYHWLMTVDNHHIYERLTWTETVYIEAKVNIKNLAEAEYLKFGFPITLNLYLLLSCLKVKYTSISIPYTNTVLQGIMTLCICM